MGSSIGFFCGNEDHRALQEFGESIGLIAIAPTIDKDINQDVATGPFCFLSLLPKTELHPYGNPAVRLTDAKDPIMRFMRGYFLNPYLVAGHIYWSNDVPEIATQTRPYYKKISKWIKSNWELLSDGGYYIGPEAQSLLNAGAAMVNTLPGQTEFHLVEI